MKKITRSITIPYAYSLKIPMEIISVKHAESFMNANGADTGFDSYH